MKKMLSLAAVLAVLSYASPASAELKLSGDAAIRERGEFATSKAITGVETKTDDLKAQYRIRLNAAADLGDGFFFKAQLTNERPERNVLTNETVATLGGGGGWQTLGYGNTETYTLGVSQFYFGRAIQDCHYAIGRLPLNSVNNPIFDLTLYPTQPLEIPVSVVNNDRVFGGNYGTKIGNGELNATFVVLDNKVKQDTAGSGDGLFNDGYGLLVSYKTTLGNVTIDPQVITVLTKSDVWSQSLATVHEGFRPVTFGSNASVPVGDAKLGLGAFYTRGSGTTPTNAVYPLTSGDKVDYFAYLLRVKAEVGNFTAWYDHNTTTDKSTAAGSLGLTAAKHTYNNNFVWAQYKVNLHQSAARSFSLTPTLRYLTTRDNNDLAATETSTKRLRTELYATVTF